MLVDVVVVVVVESASALVANTKFEHDPRTSMNMTERRIEETYNVELVSTNARARSWNFNERLLQSRPYVSVSLAFRSRPQSCWNMSSFDTTRV
jgi:hypothetical protein